jgi:hypothetical protein
MRREDCYQYPVTPTPFQEVQGAVRAKAVKNEQSPISPGIIKSLLVEQAL